MRISKQKRNQLILIGLVMLMAVAGLWFTLIRYQQDSLQAVLEKEQQEQSDVSKIQDTIKNSRQIETDLNSLSNRLASLEDDMASGDLYSSMDNTVRKFKLPYKVEIPQFNSGGPAVDSNLLPKFPYKQMTITIAGTAHYADLGRFIADFENRFPSSRVLNLELTPATAASAQDREKLSFRMDLVSLVKSAGARPATSP
jgi:Tfp pilus assembly protein PilO